LRISPANPALAGPPAIRSSRRRGNRPGESGNSPGSGVELQFSTHLIESIHLLQLRRLQSVQRHNKRHQVLRFWVSENTAFHDKNCTRNCPSPWPSQKGYGSTRRCVNRKWKSSTDQAAGAGDELRHSHVELKSLPFCPLPKELHEFITTNCWSTRKPGKSIFDFSVLNKVFPLLLRHVIPCPSHESFYGISLQSECRPLSPRHFEFFAGPIYLLVIVEIFRIQPHNFSRRPPPISESVARKFEDPKVDLFHIQFIGVRKT